VVRWSSIFIFVLAPLIGCGFDTPVPGQSGRGSDTTAPTQPQPTDATHQTDQTRSNLGAASGLGPQSSCDAEVAVSGITTPLQSVVIHNALGNFERSTDADQSGRFCFAVSLTAGFNQFTVLAVDGSMQPLMQRSVTIEQSGCQGTSPNEAQANLVAGRYPTTDLSINGQLSALTDDDPKTSVELRGGLPWADAAGWVMIDLQRRIEVEMLQIDWRDSLGSGARYGRRFMILVSESDQYNKPSWIPRRGRFCVRSKMAKVVRSNLPSTGGFKRSPCGCAAMPSHGTYRKPSRWPASRFTKRQQRRLPPGPPLSATNSAS
jgi:hypothetical protein